VRFTRQGCFVIGHLPVLQQRFRYHEAVHPGAGG
jgi:hypothetical protein